MELIGNLYVTQSSTTISEDERIYVTKLTLGDSQDSSDWRVDGTQAEKDAHDTYMDSLASMWGGGYSVTRSIGSDSTDLQIATAKASYEAKKLLFIDLWNKACVCGDETYGTYNAGTGYFECNGLTDITYDQAIVIYNASSNFPSSLSCDSAFLFSPIRTNLCRQRTNGSANCNNFNTGFYSSDLEVIRIGNPTLETWINYANLMCGSAKKVKKIIGILSTRNAYTSYNTWNNLTAFNNCFLLEEVKIYGLKHNIGFAQSSLLNKESVIYMLTNRMNAVTTSITLTLEATAYAKYNADADVLALLPASETYGPVTLASA